MIALRALLAILLLASSASADSIVASSGRGSIVVSGRAASPQETPAEPFVEVEKPKPTPTPQVSPPTPQVAPETPQVTERWLISEGWCPNCPAAKAAFLASGGAEDHILSIAEAKRRHGVTVSGIPHEYTTRKSQAAVQAAPAASRQAPAMPQRYVYWPQYGRIDLETYGGCRSSRCGMCAQIRAKQQEYRRAKAAMNQKTSAAELPAHQQPTPADTLTRMLSLLELTHRDVLADLGCGDGRILIEAAQKYGCSGIGVEIDPERAEAARRSVADAGLSGKIQIITGDALDFDPERHRVTAITAYLYPTVLEKLAPKFRTVRVGASPFHAVPGLSMTENGDVWVYRSSPSTATPVASSSARYRIFDGQPGSSHQNRASLINHLLNQGVHKGHQHSLGELQAMSDQQLDDLHTEDHREAGQVKVVSVSGTRRTGR